MRLRMILCVLIFSLGGIVTAQSLSFVPQDEENVRGAFLTTRPKDKTSPPKSTGAKPSRRRPKPASTTTTSTDAKVTPATTTGVKKNDSPAKMTPQRIGLGLTLFMRDSNGLAVRVDPAHEFHAGDRVRVLVETNANGFLYIFNTTDGGQPVMIYPDSDLDEAGNYIESHVPFEIPSSVTAEERLRWFRFDDHAGTERLYFVFTREPMQGVPIEDDLITFCRDSKTRCPWHPSPDLWAEIQKEMSAPLQTDKAQKYGKAQTTGERTASTRGLGLSQEDPEPSLVMMTASAGTKSLVTALDLVHR